MSPTEKIGEELRRIFLSKDTPTHRRTPQERYRDSVGAYAVGCLAAAVFFFLMSKIVGGKFPSNMPMIGWALGLIDDFALPGYWLLLAWWVYLDAKIRGMNAPPWGLLCLASNVIGLFTYLIVRNPDPINCEGCGRVLEPGLRMCPFCGAVTERVCPSCGAPIGPDWQFCPSCASVIPQRVASVQAAGPRIPAAGPIGDEQRAVDIPRIIEQAQAAASSAEEASVRVAEAVERIASGEVFTQRTRITGCVFDAATGKPIAGAAIRSDASVPALNATTDGEGMYSFIDLQPGPYVLVSEAEGYHRSTRSCNAGPGQSVSLDFRLAHQREPAAASAEPPGI